MKLLHSGKSVNYSDLTLKFHNNLARTLGVLSTTVLHKR